MALFHFTITQARIFLMKKYKIFNYPSKYLWFLQARSTRWTSLLACAVCAVKDKADTNAGSDIWLS